jgi:hypothetical protein
MLATKLGLKLDGRRKVGSAFRISGTMSVMARSITQTATGTPGLWTTTIAAAVLVT